MALKVLEEAKRALTAHHICNIIACISFYCSKTIEPICHILYSNKVQCHIEQREYEIMLLLFFILVFKNRKASGWMHYLSNVFVFTKLANSVLFFRMSPAAGIIYVSICIVMSLLLPEPIYKGPEKVTYFQNDGLRRQLLTDADTTWVIEFYTNWSPECKHITEPFAQISEKFTLPNLRFGKLDIGRWSKEAEHFRINAAPTSRQLPTVAVFIGGKERRRRPLVADNGRAVPFVFSMVCYSDNMVTQLDLNGLHKKCNEESKKNDATRKVE